MADVPATQPSLLIRLGDKQDTVAWGQFVEVYAPLVYGFARKHGMQDADAADLTQEVMRAVAGPSVGWNTIRGAALFAAGCLPWCATSFATICRIRHGSK